MYYPCGKNLAKIRIFHYYFNTEIIDLTASKSIKDVILEEPKKSGEPTEPVVYEPEDKSHLTKWDRCKIWCCNAYHPYKKLPMLKWIQVILSLTFKSQYSFKNDDVLFMSHHFQK